MDTEKCAALLCALEEGTLARAAERLGYTPSGISRMVAALEEELGFPLLYRSRGGVTATGECEALLGAMRQMVYQAECCRQTAAALRGVEQGSVTVGANYHFYSRQLAHLMARFRQRHPGSPSRPSRAPAPRWPERCGSTGPTCASSAAAPAPTSGFPCGGISWW